MGENTGPHTGHRFASTGLNMALAGAVLGIMEESFGISYSAMTTGALGALIAGAAAWFWSKWGHLLEPKQPKQEDE